MITPSEMSSECMIFVFSGQAQTHTQPHSQLTHVHPLLRLVHPFSCISYSHLFVFFLSCLSLPSNPCTTCQRLFAHGPLPHFYHPSPQTSPYMSFVLLSVMSALLASLLSPFTLKGRPHRGVGVPVQHMFLVNSILLFFRYSTSVSRYLFFFFFFLFDPFSSSNVTHVPGRLFPLSLLHLSIRF